MEVALAVLLGLLIYGVALYFVGGLVWAAWGAIRGRSEPGRPGPIREDSAGSRRPLAHMNPLSVDDVTNVEVAFRKWVKQLRAVENLIP